MRLSESHSWVPVSVYKYEVCRHFRQSLGMPPLLNAKAEGFEKLKNASVFGVYPFPQNHLHPLTSFQTILNLEVDAQTIPPYQRVQKRFFRYLLHFRQKARWILTQYCVKSSISRSRSLLKYDDPKVSNSRISLQYLRVHIVFAGSESFSFHRPTHHIQIQRWHRWYLLGVISVSFSIQ